MPIIQIHMMEGRPADKKERLIQEVSQTVSEVLEAPLETVRVLINEIPSEHWGIAGQSVRKRREKKEEAISNEANFNEGT